jgi:hypothetical protein
LRSYAQPGDALLPKMMDQRDQVAPFDPERDDSIAVSTIPTVTGIQGIIPRTAPNEAFSYSGGYDGSAR